jgi:soluble lytic murein transglycosylase-like protein
MRLAPQFALCGAHSLQKDALLTGQLPLQSRGHFSLEPQCQAALQAATLLIRGARLRAFITAMFLLLGLGIAAPEPEYAWLFGHHLRARAEVGPPPQIAVESSHRTDAVDAAISPASAPAQEMSRLIELPLAAINPDVVPEQSASLDDLCNALFTSAQDNGLPVPFFANLIWQESRLRDDVVSPVGAQGIAQFMPEVAAETGLENPFDPMQAIPASARLLRELRGQFGNLGFVAAAYNAGAHRVGEWLARGRALPRETLNYVLRVTGRSAEQWRSAPPTDIALTFAQHLPCRSMPAFADLEQTQLAQLQARQPAQAPAKPVEDATATPDTAKTTSGPERHGRDKKVSLAKAWAKALDIADRDDLSAGRHHARHERQASHDHTKGGRMKRLATAELGWLQSHRSTLRHVVLAA